MNRLLNFLSFRSEAEESAFELPKQPWLPVTPTLQSWVSHARKESRGITLWGAFFFFFIFAIPAPSTNAQTVKLALPEADSTVTLSFTPLKRQTVAATFRSIQIQSAGQRITFSPKVPIARVPVSAQDKLETGITTIIQGTTLDPSRYFFVGHYTTDSQPHTVVFFVSEPDINAAALFVIGFSSQGIPYTVLERDQLDPYALVSTASGTLLAGKVSESQALCGSAITKGPTSATYDPYSVFLLTPDSPARYSLSESRAYNLKHYAWAGPKASERFTVIENLPGHPKIFVVPGPQADKLMAKVKCDQ